MRAAEANRRLLLRLGAAAVGMFFFGFALVPLYDVFCEVTGLNGKTGRVSEAQARAMAADPTRQVKLQLVASVNDGLPWEFHPETGMVRVRPGEPVVVNFRIRNPTDAADVGQAVPSVAPSAAARYLDKIECFCFSRQPLAPGERRTMPVRLVIDPALPADVHTLTLAYTFFRATPER